MTPRMNGWRARLTILALLSVVVLVGEPAAAQEPTERRFGLVIGNSEYQAGGTLPTAANDAGLIAQTLQAAGFDVMGARDLDGDAMRQTFRDFVQKVSEAGPDAVAFVYLSGHAVQFEGENYFVPIDARMDRDIDVPLQALRISDYVRPMGATRAKAIVVALDAARENQFARQGRPLAGGLALMEPMPGMLFAFNAAPGTIGPPANPPYSPYAEALAEMIRAGGTPLDQLFDRVRLRVHERTSGTEVPWHASQVKAPFVFFEREADAPQEASIVTSTTRRSRPVRSFEAEEAYLAALERDSLEGYLEFLEVFPRHPQAGRVRAIVAARREAITWRRTRNADTPEAYWSYLDRYPNGPHAWDARRRLAYLTAPPDPPPRYVVYDYGLPPPPPEEIIIIERRPVVYFADPYWRFAPLAVVPILFLPPRPPPLFFHPPPPPPALYVLPVPVFVPVARYVRPPVYVAPPPNNLLFQQIRNRTPVPPQVPAAVQPTPAVQAQPPSAGGISPVAVGAGAAAAAAVGAAVALPPSVAKRAVAPTGPGLPGARTPQPGATPTGLTPPAGITSPPSGKGPVQPKAPPLTTAPPTGGPAASVPGTALPGTPKGAPLPQPKSAVVTPPSASGAPGAKTVQPPSQVPGASPQAAQPPVQGQPALQKKGPPLPQGIQRPIPGQQIPAQQTPTQKSPTQKTPTQQAAPNPTETQPPLRQQRIDRAQQDRGQVERGLQQQRQQDLERRRQEEAARSQARQNQQLQDLQRQRQQQQEQQRRAMDQQRQQQIQQQQQQRAQQQQQRAQQEQQRQQQAQQQRAQAEAQARARAQQQQQQQKKCGAPGLPPCPPR